MGSQQFVAPVLHLTAESAVSRPLIPHVFTWTGATCFRRRGGGEGCTDGRPLHRTNVGVILCQFVKICETKCRPQSVTLMNMFLTHFHRDWTPIKKNKTSRNVEETEWMLDHSDSKRCEDYLHLVSFDWLFRVLVVDKTSFKALEAIISQLHRIGKSKSQFLTAPPPNRSPPPCTCRPCCRCPCTP